MIKVVLHSSGRARRSYLGPCAFLDIAHAYCRVARECIVKTRPELTGVAEKLLNGTWFAVRGSDTGTLWPASLTRHLGRSRSKMVLKGSGQKPRRFRVESFNAIGHMLPEIGRRSVGIANDSGIWHPLVLRFDCLCKNAHEISILRLPDPQTKLQIERLRYMSQILTRSHS